MYEAFSLMVVNLVFMFFLVKFMEVRVHKRYTKQYGANIDEFESIINNIKDFNFNEIPKPKKGKDTVYNNLLIVTSSYFRAYRALDDSKNQLIEFSSKNNDLIKSYICVLNALKVSTIKFRDTGGSVEKEVDDVLSKIDESIKRLS
jgi:hypothetical protein